MHYDKTFGAERHLRTPRPLKGNFPPSAGYINFGHGEINAKTGALTISIRWLEGESLYTKTISAASKKFFSSQILIPFLYNVLDPLSNSLEL